MKILNQIFRFFVVGILSTLIDYILMVLFTEYFGIYYLVSSTISFTISLIFNYLFSMKFVFHRKENIDRKSEFIIFVTFSVMGLFINQITMWIFVEKWNFIYKIGKIFATFVVMFWNFVTRKIFLERKS